MLVPSSPNNCVTRSRPPLRPQTAGRQFAGAGPSHFEPIKHHWWKGALFVAMCAFGTYQLSNRMKPMYETAAMVEVDDQQPTGIIGKDAEKPFPTNDSDEFLGTQVKLIQSDNVLRPVAMKYGLLELEGQINGLNKPEDDRLRNAPVTLKRLKVSRQPNTKLLTIAYRAPSPETAANAANDIAKSYVQRVYELRSHSSAALSQFMEGQLQGLEAKVESSNRRLTTFEREMGVINPEQRTSIISARLLQLTTEHTNAQAERQRKETAYAAVKDNAPEAAQVSSQGEPIAKMNEKLLAAKEKLASEKALYGANHPEYRKTQSQVNELTRQLEDTKIDIGRRIETDYRQAVAREQMLAQTIAATKAEFDNVNSRMVDYEQLKHEADDDRTMYAELLRKVRESSINAGFQNHNIRIADYARPPFKPVTPNLPLNLAMAILISIGLAIGWMILMGDKTLHSPAETSRRLNVSVIGAIPNVKGFSPMISAVDGRRLLEGSGGETQYRADLTVYHESIRKLRNTVVLARDFAEMRSVLITSAMPGEGKSVMAADLALSCVRQHRRTLLMDADLRRPAIHERFNLDNQVGLSDVLHAGVDWRRAIQTLPGLPELAILPAGSASMAAADLFGSGFRSLLQALEDEFDLVVVDSPPMLPFAEPAQIASSVDGVMLVVRAGTTTAAAAESVLSSLEWAGANVLGVVLNQVRGGGQNQMYGHAYGYGRDDKSPFATSAARVPPIGT